MYYLTDKLREKSGLDGDGQDLVGRALGGKSPVLRVNRLQTQTEQDIQKGLEQILRGMYMAIRNPRNHEAVEDTEDTADAIILFINYLLGILEGAQEPFTIPGFLQRVFDRHFVQSNKYAELLVAEIPAGKRLDVLIEIYRRKREGSGSNLEYVVEELLGHLSEDQKAHFLLIVSEELEKTNSEEDIRLTLQILRPDLWSELKAVSRLRMENILIKSIEKGEVDLAEGEPLVRIGALGTWATSFLPYFESRSEVGRVILDKLDRDFSEQLYVFHFVLDNLSSLYENAYSRKKCIKALIQAVKGDIFGEGLAELLREHYWSFPEDWRKEFDQALPDLSAPDLPF